MFFRNDTKIIITRLDLSIPGMVAAMSPSNSHLLSNLEDFTVSSDSQPIMYSESYLVIGERVNRGVHSSPSSLSGYTLSIASNICTASGITNNEILWDLFLTGEYSMEPAVQSGIISNRSNYSALKKFSVIVIIGSYCKAYTGCIVSNLSIEMQMASILTGAWDIISNRCIDIPISDLSYLFTAGELTGVGRDTGVEFIVDRLALITLNGIDLPAIQCGLTFSHNVSVVPDTTINTVGATTGYQLGSFNIDGSIRIYTRVGATSTLVNDISEAYRTNAYGLNMPLSILFKGPSSDLRLTIGDVFASVPQSNNDPILTTSIIFSANNYVDNGLKLEKV